MKQILASFCLLLLLSCSGDDSTNNCNYLLNVGVNTTINLNLPQFSQLMFTSNSVYIPNQGNAGIIVINAGTGLYAWDAADPNHQLTNCSLLTIEGANGKCGCSDENEYSLFTGLSVNNPLPCALKAYRVTPLSNNQYSITN
ncbi:MAG: hypothetical protein BM564_04290 [Bacteroidetes bacterium MedPE-SWsnd-G2]|nr:MAG: hypothetical protein BM564_04290 [Bacteroidetes bacterium MedPE-SWsnd-G2]